MRQYRHARTDDQGSGRLSVSVPGERQQNKGAEDEHRPDALGHNHAYLRQFESLGKPKHLHEQYRERLGELYKIMRQNPSPQRGVWSMAKEKRPDAYSDVQIKIGQRIKWARELVEPNRAAFARLIGVDRSTLQKIEDGDRAPSVFNILELSQRLRVTPDYILTGSLNGVDDELAGLLVTNHPALIEAALVDLEREAERLQLRPVVQHLARVKAHFLSGTARASSLHPMITQLYDRMRDVMEDRLLLTVDGAKADLYRQAVPLFGPDVAAKLPEVSEDVSEAGKCLALGRTTACVFHLMRAMEAALRIFATTLGVALAENKNWQNILEQTNKAVRAMDPGSSVAKQYAGAAANLYHVKIAWRNEVMHPKQTYTEAEASAVFAAVRGFLVDLARLL